MKAEHRKELHTNVLANRMGQFIDGIKHTPSANSIIAWTFVVLTLAVLIAWAWSSRPSEATARLWVKLDEESYGQPTDHYSNQASVLYALGKIAEDNQYTVPGRTARFQSARYQLSFGLNNLFLATARPDAIKALLNARTLFVKLSNECNDSPLLAQEALMGAAKAEEGLIGVADPKQPGKSFGSIERTRAAYGQLATKFPDSFLGGQADRYLEDLEKNGPAVEKFYVDLNEKAEAPKR